MTVGSLGFLHRKFEGGEESQLEDILRNLNYIVHSKRDASPFLADFGLSEPVHSSIEEALLRFSEELASSIARYEPRVELVEIEEIYERERTALAVHLRLRRSQALIALTVDPRERTLRWRPSGSEPQEAAGG
ncbi:MAG: GPW/gp25 family protein [Myxococcota bacterium]